MLWLVFPKTIKILLAYQAFPAIDNVLFDQYQTPMSNISPKLNVIGHLWDKIAHIIA